LIEKLNFYASRPCKKACLGVCLNTLRRRIFEMGKSAFCLPLFAVVMTYEWIERKSYVCEAGVIEKRSAIISYELRAFRS